MSSGKTERFENVPLRRVISVREGAGTFKATELVPQPLKKAVGGHGAHHG